VSTLKRPDFHVQVSTVERPDVVHVSLMKRPDFHVQVSTLERPDFRVQVSTL
jgi:hypothetical protein